MYFKDEIMKEGSWNLDEEANIMCNIMSSWINRVPREILGEAKGNGFTK